MFPDIQTEKFTGYNNVTLAREPNGNGNKFLITNSTLKTKLKHVNMGSNRMSTHKIKTYSLKPNINKIVNRAASINSSVKPTSRNKKPTTHITLETSKQTKQKLQTSEYIYLEPLEGRLGNCLFFFASASGIAHHTNKTLICNWCLSKLIHLLPKLERKYRAPEIDKNFTFRTEKLMIKFDKDLLNLPKGNAQLHGYLQSFKYFENIREIIFKSYSKINPEILKNVARYKWKVQEQVRSVFSYHKPTTVCVHVRRGDLLSFKHLGYMTVPAEDIKFAMAYMEKKFSQVIFFVASDDPQWCQEHLKKKNVFLSNLTSPEEDYTLLQSCDHMIMTTGTYGWWAGWMTSYRGGEVMYYRYPMTVGSALWKHFERATHYPGHWLSYGNNSIVMSRDIVDP